MSQQIIAPEIVNEVRDPRIERRLATRYHCKREPQVTLLLRPALQRYQASVREVSVRGVGLIVGMPLQVGTVMAIHLSSRQAGFSGILSATIRHCTEYREGKWLVGCKFSRSLTDDEMLSLL